jgi:hypothetical protein
MNYKAPDNSLHSLSEEDVANGGEAYLPAGAVAITDAEAEALRPVPPAPTYASLKAVEIAKYKDMREKMLARVTNIGQRLSAAGDNESAASCVAVSNSLLELFTDATVIAATDIVEFKSALKSRYIQAIALASAIAKAEFKRYDA